MDPVEALRPKRKELVIAAEKVASGMFQSGKSPGIGKSQLNHLISVCGEATCTDEIENYLHYQAGRRGPGWTVELASSVIAGPGAVIADTNLDDRSRVEAWRLYAIFLTRAFTFHFAAKQSAERDRPRPDSSPREKRR